MPNTFAYIVLFAWPVLVFVLFRLTTVPKAIAISIVAGYLVLPTRASFDLPLLPEYERALAASLPALLIALFMPRPTGPAQAAQPPAYALPGWLPQQRLLKFLVLVLIASPFLTVLANGDTLHYGDPSHPRFAVTVLPGLKPYDGASVLLAGLVSLLPFFMARKYLAHPREQIMLLGILFAAALAYSLPTLWEVRMSPQLNRDIYGFFPHSWRQHLRGGGYRPLVFLEHGLKLGIFFALSIVAAVGFIRTRKSGDQKALLGIAVLWLLATLVVSKTLGATLIVMLLLPIVVVFGARMQILMAAILAATVLTYPMTRATGIFPVHTVTQIASVVGSGQRIESLRYRLDNEEVLLEKARERPLFGWGGWARARVYDDRGRDVTTTDGTWIIRFGEQGWVGYLSTFGLLTLPVVLLAFRRKAAEATIVTGALSLALVANLIDVIPNSALTPITWLMAGSLAGCLEVSASAAKPDAAAAAETPRHLPYRRFGAPAARPENPPRGRPARAGAPAGPVRRYARGGGKGRS